MKNLKVSNLTYDTLKLIAILILPISEFISTIAIGMGWDATIILLILTALHTLLGSVLKALSDNYHPEDEA